MRIQIPQLTFQLHFKTLILALLISIFLLLGAGFLARSLRSEPPSSILAGQQMTDALIAAVGQSERVTQMSGGYYPDEGLFLYATVEMGEQTAVRTWLGTQLLPFAEQLAALPDGEVVIWVVTLGEEQLVLRAPLNRAAEATTHRFVSHAGGLLADLPSLPVEAEEAVPVVGIPVQDIAVVEPLEETAVADDLPMVPAFEGGQAFDFEIQTGDWLVLDGDWQMTEGVYRQRSQDGFDFITMLDAVAPQTYALQADFRQLVGTMGGGLVFNAPFSDRRSGAQIVDFDDEGRFLRWGHYLENDNFVFDGGVALPTTVADGSWHTLRVEMGEQTAVFFLDGQPVGQVGRLNEGAYVGLVTSLSAVEFDNFSLTNLGEGEGVVLPEPEAAVEPAVVEPAPLPAVAPNGGFGQTIVSGFESGAAGWQPLSGSWAVNEGGYVQSDSSGFDFISMLNTASLEGYTLEARLRSLDGQLGGGFVYHAPSLEQRNGAQLVDFTEAGSLLRWGYYDEAGVYQFVGSTAVEPAVADGEWQQLRLVTSGTQTEIFLNDEAVAQIENQAASGFVGLMTSQAQVEFDDVNVVELPADSVLFSTEDFVDEFSGTVESWAGFDGSWEIIEGELRQTALGGVDQGWLSPFYGRNYTLQARFRLVEGKMGGGFLFNASSREQRNGSQMLALTQQGAALQWGHFDEEGNFVFEGITDVRQFDPNEWHTLKVSVVDGIATFVFDNDLLIENIALTYDSGYVGLINSLGHLAVDDFQVTLDTSSALTEQAVEPVERVYNFDEPDNPDWMALAGEWEVTEGVYEQRQQTEFDRISRLDVRMRGDYRFGSRLRYIEGEMGGGLIFNMQQPDSKAEAQMVSFTANGEFLQWGHFDEAGVFTYEGGISVPSAEDGEWHQLTVITSGDRFGIELNGELIAEEILLTYQNGYVGLFDGLSWVAYDDVTLTGLTLLVTQEEAPAETAVETTPADEAETAVVGTATADPEQPETAEETVTAAEASEEETAAEADDTEPEN